MAASLALASSDFRRFQLVGPSNGDLPLDRISYVVKPGVHLFLSLFTLAQIKIGNPMRCSFKVPDHATMITVPQMELDCLYGTLYRESNTTRLDRNTAFNWYSRMPHIFFTEVLIQFIPYLLWTWIIQPYIGNINLSKIVNGIIAQENLICTGVPGAGSVQVLWIFKWLSRRNLKGGLFSPRRIIFGHTFYRFLQLIISTGELCYLTAFLTGGDYWKILKFGNLIAVFRTLFNGVLQFVPNRVICHTRYNTGPVTDVSQWPTCSLELSATYEMIFTLWWYFLCGHVVVLGLTIGHPIASFFSQTTEMVDEALDDLRKEITDKEEKTVEDQQLLLIMDEHKPSFRRLLRYDGHWIINLIATHCSPIASDKIIQLLFLLHIKKGS